MDARISNIVRLSAACALALSLAAAPRAAHAEETAVEGSFSTAFATRYAWRGQTLSKGLVAQPTATVTLGGFSANFWSNVDLDSGEAGDDGIVMNETDVTLSYTVAIGKVSLTGSFTHYDFDGVAGATAAETTTGYDTQEVSLAAAVETLLNPSLTLSYDIDEGDGAFAVLAVSQEIPAGPLSLSAGGSVGFNLGNKTMGTDADGKDFTGLYYGEVSLATSIPLFGKVSLEPRIAYAAALGSDGKNAVSDLSVDGKKEIFYGSIAVTAAF